MTMSLCCMLMDFCCCVVDLVNVALMHVAAVMLEVECAVRLTWRLNVS